MEIGRDSHQNSENIIDDQYNKILFLHIITEEYDAMNDVAFFLIRNAILNLGIKKLLVQIYFLN